MRHLLSSGFAAALLAIAATPQEPRQSAGPEVVRVQRDASDKERAVLFEPGEHAVWDLVQRVGDELQRSYVPGDPGVAEAAAATVVLRFPLRLPPDEFDGFVERMLAHAGLFAVPLHAPGGRGLYQVLSSAGPRRHERWTSVRFVAADELLAKRVSHGTVATVVALEHVDAASVSQEIRVATSNQPREQPLVVTPGGRGHLTLLGTASEVAEIVALVRAIDALAAREVERATALEQRLLELAARVEALEAAAKTDTSQKQR